MRGPGNTLHLPPLSVKITVMLIPQYSLRWLLGVMTGSAVVFSIFAMGLRGNLWAAGGSVAILAVVVAALVHVGLFVLVWFAGLVLRIVLPSMWKRPASDIDAPVSAVVVE
jgi:hypothetical protein